MILLKSFFRYFFFSSLSCQLFFFPTLSCQLPLCYIMFFSVTSEFKVIVVCICYELPFSILSVSMYYETQSGIRVKTNCRLILLRPFVLNFERLDILRDTIGHWSKKLLSFEFAQSFCFQCRSSRYTTGHNRTSE